MKKNKIVKLTEREHVLLKPGMYIGNTELSSNEGFILNKETQKFEFKEHSSCNGLLKIINEIIDNSVDEGIRTNFIFGNKISVSISDNTVEIIDNGRGLPTEKESTTELPQGVLAFTHARSGSNFNNEDRKTVGTNGVGSFCTVCFSEKFKVHSLNLNKQELNLTCKNNLEDYTYTIKKSNKNIKPFTKIVFSPDFSKFALDNFNEDIINLINQRLINLAVSYPKITFKFQKRVIKQRNNRIYLNMYNSTNKFIETDKYFIGITSNESDDFKQVSLINGLEITEGGSHIEYLMYNIIQRLYIKLKRRFKTIKKGDIKNKIQCVVVFKEFNNCKFDSQTKERLTNSNSEIKDYLGEIDFDLFVNKLLKTPEIIGPIEEYFKIKEEYKNKLLIKEENKNNKKIRVKNSNYISAIKRNKYFVICEGLSARAGISPILGREDFGFFAAKGVPMNTYSISHQKLFSNKEFKVIMQILNIQIGKMQDDLNYENILIATDSDSDGAHILGLFLTFFYKFAPSLLTQNKIKKLRTPVIILKNKRTDKIEKFFFTLNEYNEFKKNNDCSKYLQDYKKGLGSWEQKEFEQLISEYGVNYFIETLVFDKKAKEFIHNWMSAETISERKTYLLENNFDIFSV